MAEHLTPSGRAGIIVPEGIVERSDAAYQKLRELLLREYLVGVVSLPAGLFLPYTKVKTSILVLDRVRARKGEPVMFTEVDHVGISLDAARSPVRDNDLPQAILDYEALRAGRRLSSLSWLVDRRKMIERGYTLVGSKFRPRASAGIYPFVRLAELCRIEKGTASSTRSAPGEFPLVVRGEENLTSATYEYEGEAVCVPILSLAHGKGQIKRVHYVRGRFAVANLLAVLQPRDPKRLDARYLYLVLDRAKNDLAQRMQGSVYVTLKLEDLEDFHIPLPPIEVQLALANKYDHLQTVIQETEVRVKQLRSAIEGGVDQVFGE